MIPKGEESRLQILHAARELIAKQGFNAITLQDILDAADITKGKFFHYFKSKDHLFEELLRWSMNEREFLKFGEVVAECKEQSPFKKLLHLMDRVIEWHSKGLPEAMRLCVFATVFFSPAELKKFTEHLSSNTKVLRGLLSNAQKKGELPKSLSPDILSLLIPSAAIGANTIQFISGEKNLTPNNLRELRTMLVELQQSMRRKA